MVRRVRVLKNRKETQGELMKRLLEENPRPNPERERFFAGLIGRMEAGKMSEADFKKELGVMKREVESPREGYRRYIPLGTRGSGKESGTGRIGGEDGPGAEEKGRGTARHCEQGEKAEAVRGRDKPEGEYFLQNKTFQERT